MNLRNAPRRLSAFASAAAFLVLAATAPAQDKPIESAKKEEVVSAVTQLLTRSAFVPGIDFKKWPDFLAAEKEKIDKADTEESFQRAVNGALAKFGASHIVLSTPRMAENRRSGQQVGVGITTQPVDEGLTIIRTVKDGPAAKAGVQPGDVVTKVDGKPVSGISGIPGPEGTNVVLTIKRDGAEKDYLITRAKFSTVRKEELTWLDKDTAKLDVYTFDFSYDTENVEKLMQEAMRSRNLILDLRDNGGGAVVNMEHLLGMFLPADSPIGTFVSKSLVRRYTEATGDSSGDLVKIAAWSDQKIKPRLNRRVPRYKGNVVVLVNRFSGSASEIAASALRDNIGAKVVGTKSAGAVLVSVIVPASNGFMLQYPLSDYVTIKGQRLEGTGVAPDVEAEDPKLRLPNVKDDVVTKTREVLVAKTGAGVR